MLKRILFLFVGFLLAAGFLFGGGGKEKNESRTAGEPTNFTDSFDLTDKKTGKWNFYIESTDRAGNVSLAGPANIYNDPETDLPTVAIINPVPNMRVQGNLNMVGIANDDDGVSAVEVVVHRGKDGKGEELVRVTAAGTDYWSYMLDTTNPEIWTDGHYTVTAWSVDEKGLRGDLSNASQFDYSFKPKQTKIHQIFWQLDRKKPEIHVTSHEIGELVAGRVRLRGTVADGNGIAGFAYSIDGGERYQSVKTSLDKKTGLYSWDIDLNSKVFEDGPAVIWFRGTDSLGSVGTAAHLLNINNTGPLVKIVYPEANEVVTGLFTIAGYASHPIGLKSLTWKAGKLAGEFELLPGNHWWSQVIDLRGQKDTSIDIEIRGEDVSGNVTVAKQRYRVNPNADLPTVKINEPVTGVTLAEGNNIIVKGEAHDNNAVSSIFYSHNGGEAVELPAAAGDFSFIIPSVNEGTHNLEIWARDINGTAGPKVQIRNIIAAGEKPEISIATLTAGPSNAQPRPFYTGMTARLEPKGKANFEVAIKAGAIANATVQIGDLAPAAIRPSAARDGVMRATVQMPLTLPSGYTKIEIRATDRQGRETVYPDYIFVEQLGQELYGQDRWFNWIRPKEAAGGRILLTSYDDVLIGLSNYPFDPYQTALSGAGADSLNLTVDENGRIILRALREGVFGPLTVEASGLTTSPFYIAADFSGPVITIQEPASGSIKFVQNTVNVNFSVASPARVTTLESSLDMGETWQSIPVSMEVSREFDISASGDGLVTILLRAQNESGLSSMAHFCVLKDTEAPAASLIMPIDEYRVNGTIRMGFEIKDAGKIKTVTYSRAGNNITVYNEAESAFDYEPNFLEVLMDSTQMPLDENMSFIFEDMAGNVSTLNQWPFIIDQEMDIPVVHIVLPLDNEVITSDFVASGIVYDDDGIKNIQWRLDEGAWQTVEAENGFAFPISLSSLTDNEHSITVIAEDIYGVQSEPVTREFRVSLAEPTGQMEFPVIDTVVRDSVELRGVADDGNGIKEVYISINNGATYSKAQGNTAWTYRFNTRILKDGAHVIFIKVVDNYDIEAMYASMINVDNTEPEITLDSPTDGFISTGSLSALGRIIDPNLVSVNLEIRSLTGAQVGANLRSRELEVREIVREVIDLTGQPDGLYNIELTAADKAGNISRLSRNFELARTSITNFVEILYPIDNENLSGEFFLYGYAGGVDEAETVTLRINGVDRATAEVDRTGYWKFFLNSEILAEENNQIIVHSNFGGASQINSRLHNLVYKNDGPWVAIDSFNFGQYAYNRPYLYGRTGYILSEEDRFKLADRGTDREERAEIQNKTPLRTEISFDNGRTYQPTKKGKGKDQDFRYRLETGEMPEGMHYILVRTTMKNGEVAITSMIVQVDKTPPVIRLITPEEGGRYNETITYSATASDDVELVSTTYHLRQGDKSLYELPGFLQGLYFDVTIPPFLIQAFNQLPTVFSGGVTYMDIGFGLSFFDDNVKLQLQYGFLTQSIYESYGGKPATPSEPITFAYGGNVFGLKLLANVYHLEFKPLFGPDWEWLSLDVAIGANFSMFTIAPSGSLTMMSALLLQLEFPKVKLPDVKYFGRFSMFTEFALWFRPLDVPASVYNVSVVNPKILIGLRSYVF